MDIASIIDRVDLDGVAAKLDVDLTRPAALLAVAVEGAAEGSLSEAAARLADEHGGLSREHGGAILLMLPGVSRDEVARVHHTLGEVLGVPVRIG